MESGAGLKPGSRLAVVGDEAHHAVRVKRLEKGDPVEFMDGSGLRASGVVASTSKHGKSDWRMEVELAKVEVEAMPAVRLEVYAAAAKGERLEEMVDGLSQVGVTMFRPLLAERTVVDPREGKLSRLRRTALESAKQCGRSWAIEIGEAISLQDALKQAAPDVLICVADAQGNDVSVPAGIKRCILLVGPEGGWSPGESAKFRESNIALFRYAPHVLRVETAAVLGGGVLAMRLLNHVH